MRDAILASSVVATFAILSYSMKEYFRVKREVMLIKALTEFLKQSAICMKGLDVIMGKSITKK